MIKTGYRLLKNIAGRVLGFRPSFPSLVANTVGKDDVKLCREWLKRPDEWFNREITDRFNREFAGWNGSGYAFAFMGGRVALSACIAALGLQPGDEAILPGYTCVVVPNAFRFAGIKIVYCDIEPHTYGLCAAEVKKKITANTRAILLHHLYGLVCRDYEEIMEIAAKNNLYVIEDCAQSTGAKYKNKNTGNWGDAAIYSSEHSKALSTVQGGIAVSNRKEIGEKLGAFYDSAPFPDKEFITKILNTLIYDYYTFAHPRRWLWADWAKFKYGGWVMDSTTTEEIQGIRPGHYGCKMPAPLAALGLNQLGKLDAFNQRRRANAARWDRWCDVNNYEKPLIVKDSIPIYLRYPVQVGPEKKRDLTWAVKELSVWPGIWFKTNVHPSNSVWEVTDCPNADRAVAGCINMPTLDI